MPPAASPRGPQGTVRAIVAAVLLAGLSLLGCGHEPPADTSDLPVRARLIDDPPSAALDPATWTAEEPVFRWSFHDAADLAPWEAQDVDGRFEIDGDGFVAETSSHDPRLVRPVEIDAGEVHAIHVRMGPAADGSAGKNTAQLFWAGPQQSFAEERGVSVEVTQDGESTYVFAVGRNPGWAGPIRRLRLDPTGTAGLAMRVREIVGMRHRVREDGLREVATRPWRVDVGNEVRSAFLVPPGDALEWDVRVPAAGHLRLAHAMWRELAAPATTAKPPALRVTVTPEGGPAEQVLSQSLAPSAERARWRDHDVDLSPWAGRTIRIAIAEQAEEPRDPLRGLLLVANPEVVASAAPDRPTNVLLISIDTLRADHLSLQGYARQTSPNIDAWAARAGVVFENAFAQAPWTLPSHVSMLTGLDPVHHGANYDRPLPAGLPMLAERLRDAGYATAATTGGVYLHPRYGFDRGFDRYHYWYSDGGPPLMRELDDGVERTRAFLREHTAEPFFLFLHTYEVHSPYWHREEYLRKIDGPPVPPPPRNVNLYPLGDGWTRSFVHRHEPRWHGPNAPGEPKLADSELPAMVRLYDAGILYADERIGAVLAELDALGLAENTLVVLTSDHGEMMGEHGEFSHASLHDPVLHVPLVFALPSRFQGGCRVDAQVRSVDIVPTVLDTLGLPAPSGVDGVSLLPRLIGSGGTPALDAWAYAPHPNLGIALRVDDELKYVFNDAALAPIAGDEELYLLPGDAGEEHDVAATDGHTAGLRARVRAHLDERAGLRAVVTNASAKPLRLELEGHLVNPTRLKVLEAGCRCITWRKQGALVSLPPRASVTLLLEDVADGDLRIRPARDARGAATDFELALEPAGRPGPWGAELTDAGWTVLDAPERAPATGVRVWWQGVMRDVPSAAPADPELVEQLRTLGYVE